jgi:threonine dehydrogenase-like Zn-dependent dehydrogenase
MELACRQEAAAATLSEPVSPGFDVGAGNSDFHEDGIALPFVPGQEVAGVVEAAGDGAGVQPGERVYASAVAVLPAWTRVPWSSRRRSHSVVRALVSTDHG